MTCLFRCGNVSRPLRAQHLRPPPPARRGRRVVQRRSAAPGRRDRSRRRGAGRAGRGARRPPDDAARGRAERTTRPRVLHPSGPQPARRGPSSRAGSTTTSWSAGATRSCPVPPPSTPTARPPRPPRGSSASTTTTSAWSSSPSRRAAGASPGSARQRGRPGPRPAGRQPRVHDQHPDVPRRAGTTPRPSPDRDAEPRHVRGDRRARSACPGSWRQVAPRHAATTAGSPSTRSSQMTGPAAGDRAAAHHRGPDRHARARHPQQLRRRHHPVGDGALRRGELQPVLRRLRRASRPSYAESFARYGITGDGRGWSDVDPRFDLSTEPHEAYRFGWIVEPGPAATRLDPAKHTMLGRFKHEGKHLDRPERPRGRLPGRRRARRLPLQVRLPGPVQRLGAPGRPRAQQAAAQARHALRRPADRRRHRRRRVRRHRHLAATGQRHDVVRARDERGRRTPRRQPGSRPTRCRPPGWTGPRTSSRTPSTAGVRRPHQQLAGAAPRAAGRTRPTRSPPRRPGRPSGSR